jgi:hypothetical protein
MFVHVEYWESSHIPLESLISPEMEISRGGKAFQ